MEQLTMLTASPNESLFANVLKPILHKKIDTLRIPLELLKMNDNAVAGDSSVWYSTQLVCRIKFTRKSNYLLIPKRFKECFSEKIDLKADRTEKDLFRLTFENETDLYKYQECFENVLRLIDASFPKEFDCCSRYNECSDCTYCIHPDKVFAMGCGYRAILNSGTIFYGKNRNI